MYSNVYILDGRCVRFQENTHSHTNNVVSNIWITLKILWYSLTVSVQSDIQAEAERLRTELRNTTAMYNQACENLVHAQAKVRVNHFVSIPTLMPDQWF